MTRRRRAIITLIIALAGGLPTGAAGITLSIVKGDLVGLALGTLAVSLVFVCVAAVILTWPRREGDEG